MYSPFTPQQYLRRCPICAMIMGAADEWDETPPATHCPRDGVPLEILKCPACEAPIHPRGSEPMPFCAFCGALSTVLEPQLRVRPTLPVKSTRHPLKGKSHSQRMRQLLDDIMHDPDDPEDGA